MGMPLTPVWTQDHYCFYESDGSTQVGTADTQTSLDVDTTYYCVVTISDTIANGAYDLTVQWQFNHNSGGWTDIGASTAIQYANGSLTDGDTSQNSSAIAGLGTFQGSRVYESENDTAVIWSTPGDESDNHGEAWLGFTIDSAVVANGDEVLIRCVEGSGTVFTGTYTNADVDVVESADVVINANAGSYTKANQNATITADTSVTANAGAYTFTAYDGTITFSVSFTADAGSYTFTAYDATVTADTSVTANAASFTLAPQAATITANTAINAAATSYTITNYDGTITADITIGPTEWFPYFMEVFPGSVIWSGPRTIDADYQPYVIESSGPPSVTADCTVTANTQSFTKTDYDANVVFLPVTEEEVPSNASPLDDNIRAIKDDKDMTEMITMMMQAGVM